MFDCAVRSPIEVLRLPIQQFVGRVAFDWYAATRHAPLLLYKLREAHNSMQSSNVYVNELDSMSECESGFAKLQYLVKLSLAFTCDAPVMPELYVDA